MADLIALQETLRAKVVAVTICSTGLVSLAATEFGFTRSVGSFIDDGFERGMEIAITNFGLNAFPAVITSVSPNDMRVTPFIVSIVAGAQAITYPPISPLAEAPGRMITAVMPSMRAWENEAPLGTTVVSPGNGIPYLEEEFSPSGARKVGFPIRQSVTEEVGEYYLKWHGVPNVGADAMRKGMDAVKNALQSGTVLPAGIDSGHVDSDPAPFVGGIVQTSSRPVLVLTVPWVIRSRSNSN